jgi:hypothetical protein
MAKNYLQTRKYEKTLRLVKSTLLSPHITVSLVPEPLMHLHRAEEEPMRMPYHAKQGG